MIQPGSYRVAGHFGELLQGRLGADGPVVIISLPCPVLHVTAAAKPAQRFAIHSPNGPILSAARARKLLRLLGLPCPARVILHAAMPLGGGAGSSTAALVALARLAGWRGAAQTLAWACVAVEGASDPLMFDQPERLLWASRRAEIIARLPSLPAFDVLGGFYGPPRHTDATDLAFPDVTDLVEDWHHAAIAQNLAKLASIASRSAILTLAQRGCATDPTAQLAKDLGALGHVIAHTGSARGLIYPPGAIPPNARAVLRLAGFTGIVQFTAGGHP